MILNGDRETATKGQRGIMTKETIVKMRGGAHGMGPTYGDDVPQLVFSMSQNPNPTDVKVDDYGSLPPTSCTNLNSFN